jgi:hypothetical protein
MGGCFKDGLLNENHSQLAMDPRKWTTRPFLIFLSPISPADPSYPQPESKTYPQIAVHNPALLPSVFLFLCITQDRLYIMDVV